jgi:plastocyanin
MRAVATSAACILAAVAAGCGSSSTASTVAYGTAPVVAPPQTPPGTHPAKVVQMKSLRFTAATVRIKLGQTIEWINRDDVIHNVTSEDGTTIQSGNFGPGGKFEYTPKLAGTITFFCTIHPTTMQGRIIVRAS